MTSMARRAAGALAALLVTSLLLTGCGSFTDLQPQTDAASSRLEKELGSRPKVGWFVKNGKLVSLTFVFEGAVVSTMTVDEVGKHVREAVSASFNDRPEQITVSFQLSRE